MIIHNGYIMEYVPTHPLAGSNGYVKQHRIIVEQYLGRILSRNEIVHHKNGVKTDNKISNLEVTSLTKHNTIHRTGKKHSQQTREKMRMAALGNKRWQGKTHTQETKTKMSKARKKYWENKII